MKKMLFMTTKSINGGAQKWTKEQIEICLNSFECYLATDEYGWLPTHVNVVDLFLDKNIHKKFSITYLLRLYKFVKKNKIDLIVAGSANAGIYARLMKLLNRNIKIIYVSHGWSSIYSGGKFTTMYTFVEKQLSKISDSILCISKKDFQNAKNIIGIEVSKLKWITNKIYPINKNYSNTNEIKKILTVARMEIPKRIDILIAAIKELRGIELHIVGDGAQRSFLESLGNKHVVFHGEVDGFESFSDYDVFALISDSEGLPLSALEAMSAGLPIILSNVGGCFELVDDNGILVQNDPLEIRSAIEKCLKNQKRYGEKSKEIFHNFYDLEKNKNLYIEYYKDILDEK